ncbi:MAG: hypothetical protein AB1449_14660 [Chloroflexota bacterium]
MTRSSRLLVFSLTAASLAACNRSIGGEPPAYLAFTSVAATLTAAPTLPAPGSPPTRTPPPSATPLFTPTPTITAIATLGPTPSATPPPLPPGDPRAGLNLAQPHYRDDFSNRLTWIGPSGPNAENEFEDGRLRAIDHRVDTFVWWSTTVPEADAGNLYAEVSATIGACSGKDGYGLAVRVGGPNLDSGYSLEFSCDGSYRLREFNAGFVRLLRDWTAAEAILPGPNTANRIGLLARNQTLVAVANGVVIGQVDGAQFGVGTFGLFASAEETPDVTVYFDDFALWFLTS